MILIGCSRLFSVLNSHSVPSDITDPAAHTAPAADKQAMVCSVSRSTHGRRHATTASTVHFGHHTTVVAPKSGSIRFALPMQRIMDQAMRVPV